jgi:hypothetical protein
MLEAIATLRRGGTAMDIGGMIERPGLDLFAMMCAQISVIGSLWFSTGEAQDSTIPHIVIPGEPDDRRITRGRPATRQQRRTFPATS